MLRQLFAPDTLEQVKRLFHDSDDIVLMGHAIPDGDAIGSALGLAAYLKAIGKDVHVVMTGLFPSYLMWIEGANDIVLADRHYQQACELIRDAHLIGCLDFNDLTRIDMLATPVSQSRAHRLMIDHHPHPASFADVVLSVPSASSTCELVYRLIDSLGDHDVLPKSGAEALYAGMCTDTGGFTYNSNDPDVFLIISRLLSKGIDKDMIYRRIYNNCRESRLRIMGYVLHDKLEVFPELHASLFTLSEDELKALNYQSGDAEGIVNMPLTLQGHKLSISLRADMEHPGTIGVSIRSYDDVPANDMAQRFFHGGGHFNAAGGKFKGTIEEARAVALQALDFYKDLLMK